MIRESASGKFDIVIVWKLDRFARDRYDSAHYKRILKKNGVKVISAKEGISNTPEGIILESMLEGYAEYYSAELSTKVQRGMTENALKVKFNGGVIPYGYRVSEDQKLVIDPVAAHVVREIFERYADGERVLDIIDDLNARGIKRPISKKESRPFSRNSFSTMLSNRRYIGEYRFQDIIIPNGIPAIVPVDTFERVQERKRKNKLAPAKAKADEEYLLTTKLFCGHCGRMMAGESGTSKTGKTYYYYKCSGAKRKLGCKKKAVSKDWIEKLVVDRTMAMIMDNALMERLIDAIYDMQNEDNPYLDEIKRQLKDNQKRLNNIMLAIEQGIITETTKERLETLEAEKHDLENALTEAEIKHPSLSREQISFYIYSFQSLDPNNKEHKKRIIDNFINAIYLYDDKITITYNFKNFTDTISLQDFESSDINSLGAPDKTADFSKVRCLFLCPKCPVPDWTEDLLKSILCVDALIALFSLKLHPLTPFGCKLSHFLGFNASVSKKALRNALFSCRSRLRDAKMTEKPRIVHHFAWSTLKSGIKRRSNRRFGA